MCALYPTGARLRRRQGPSGRRTDGDGSAAEALGLHDRVVGGAVGHEVLQALRHQRRLRVPQLAPRHVLQPEAVAYLRARGGFGCFRALGFIALGFSASGFSALEFHALIKGSPAQQERAQLLYILRF